MALCSWNLFVISDAFIVTLIRSSAKNLKTDEQLVADFRLTGDMISVEILFNRYCHLVFAVALKYLHNKEESKDAVIDIFAKVPADLKRYEIRTFSHWIHIVTKNHCYHLLKKRINHLPEDVLDYSVPDGGRESEAEDLGLKLMEHLETSLRTLNEEQRTCIRLFYLEEKSYEEIEMMTGYSYNQVKSHIQNGKRNLRIYLSKMVKEAK